MTGKRMVIERRTIAHYDVYKGQPLDDVMKLEIAWFDKYLKGAK